MSSDQHAELVVSSDHEKSSSTPGCGLPCTHQRAPTFSKLLERILMHLNHSQVSSLDLQWEKVFPE